MANQNDSFIDEVTEELRRDRLFALFRRYGWIPVVLVLGIVGGAIWREWSISREQAKAQAWGDAVLAAEASGDPAAIVKVDPQGSADREALAVLLGAGRWAESGGKDAAIEALRKVDGNEAIAPALRDLAQLKLVMLAGTSIGQAELDQILSDMSRSGAPFEMLALEQKALALIEAGREADAITLIRQIQRKSGVSQALHQRLSNMMIALGEEPQETAEAPATN